MVFSLSCQLLPVAAMQSIMDKANQSFKIDWCLPPSHVSCPIMVWVKNCGQEGILTFFLFIYCGKGEQNKYLGCSCCTCPRVAEMTRHCDRVRNVGVESQLISLVTSSHSWQWVTVTMLLNEVICYLSSKPYYYTSQVVTVHYSSMFSDASLLFCQKYLSHSQNTGDT